MSAFVSGPVPRAFTREITASPAEFERDLRRAWPADVEAPAPGLLRIADGSVGLELRIEVRGTRRLGLFELPVIVVHYRFDGADDELARRRLLVALDRAMQRGGG